MRRLGILVLLCLAGCQGTEPKDAIIRQEVGTPLHYDVGVVHRTVTTSSPEAQQWFDRGIGLAYGFNHEEAIVCFERAIEADPGCAMCYWGKAYALGPNYNNVEMTDEASQAAHQAIQNAADRMDAGTDAEKALITALQTRYAWPAPDDRAELDQAYAEAMRQTWAAHPDDGDVAALTGEALMMLRPWKLWSPAGEPAPETPEIRSVLETGLERWPEHPALCHLYIHTMEAGPAQELLAARAVRHYARGIAMATLGRVDDALQEQQAFLQAREAVPETRLLFNNPVKEILQVATEVLAGEIEYRRGNHDTAFDHLRQAVLLDERLNYDEPWGWMEPARHALGALLTEQEHYEEAIAVYEANLDRYPENGWALHGLAESLRGLGRTEEAVAAQKRFQAAWAAADTAIPGSCFCRTKPEKANG